MLLAIHYVPYNLRMATRISGDVFMTKIGALNPARFSVDSTMKRS